MRGTSVFISMILSLAALAMLWAPAFVSDRVSITLRRILLAGAGADGVVDEAERAGAADNCTAVVVRV